MNISFLLIYSIIKHVNFFRITSTKKNNAEPLLRLYSLETPLYRNLGKSACCLRAPLMFKLKDLKQRAFTGCSFRGLTMTQEN